MLDRDAANVKHSRHEEALAELYLALVCCIHMTHGIAQRVHVRCGFQVCGLIALALTMRQPGAFKLLLEMSEEVLVGAVAKWHLDSCEQHLPTSAELYKQCVLHACGLGPEMLHQGQRLALHILAGDRRRD